MAALEPSGIRRLVAISAAGVGDSFAPTNPMMRWLIRSSTIGTMYADLEAMEQIYRATTLDWLAVRPVTLIDGKPTSRAKVVSRFRTVSVINRADVAAWLVRAVSEPDPIVERTPTIAWW